MARMGMIACKERMISNKKREKSRAHRGIAFLTVCPRVLHNLQLCLVEAHQAQVQPRKKATLQDTRNE